MDSLLSQSIVETYLSPNIEMEFQDAIIDDNSPSIFLVFFCFVDHDRQPDESYHHLK